MIQRGDVARYLMKTIQLDLHHKTTVAITQKPEEEIKEDTKM